MHSYMQGGYMTCIPYIVLLMHSGEKIHAMSHRRPGAFGIVLQMGQMRSSCGLPGCSPASERAVSKGGPEESPPYSEGGPEESPPYSEGGAEETAWEIILGLGITAAGNVLGGRSYGSLGRGSYC